jgi:O-succinylbenzoic acid--CoA ligase
VNTLQLNPALPTDADAVLRIADQAGLSDHTIFQTSGSTDEPKFVCLSREALEVSARAVNCHLGADASDTWLLVLPEFHVGGFSIPLRARISGSRVISMSGKWNAAEGARLAAEATLVSLVPTQLHDLVETGLKCPLKLRAAIIGGGRLLPDLRERAVALGWPVRETYGMTEAASQIASEDDFGSMIILPIWRTRTSSDSRLSISGEALFSGYIAGGKFEPAGEWFETSDIVTLENGALTFTGRADDTVKIMGELVNIAELERHLPADAVIGTIPDTRRENQLVLVCGPEIANPATLLTQFNESRRI